ncbi:hypothetical protein F0562_002395 [Nyssa sinensis]|uniref:WIYLD domain-containing protein n=1 Tax=Nyssa sinensis TaxID=561372 RepID=A0A5J5CAP1_9ASTE|nr:hypothetical protein F0562_002395 [Nyssa sinensis]
MAPNPRVAKAFRAMRDLGIYEEKVKPVLKKLLKLYDKNWELIEEENYRVLADAIFDDEETEAAEHRKKSENAGQEEDEEAQVHDEPERPLKRLRVRNQEGQVSPSLSNSGPRLGGTSLRQPKVEQLEPSESCSQLQSQGIAESPQPTPTVENSRPESPSLSPQPLIRNKGKLPVLPKPLVVQERSEPSQPDAADGTQT